MKTADEWQNSYPTIWIGAIKKIQLDAMKEGMLRAANINLPPFQLPTGYTGNRYTHGVHFQSGNAHGVSEVRESIMSASEKLNEKDLK